VGVLADIQNDHVTDYEIGAVDRMMALRPDIILLPGDLMQEQPGTREQVAPGFHDLMNRLSAPGGVFYVLGDVDSLQEEQTILAGTRVQLLVNEVIQTSVRGRSVVIGGVELDYGSVNARRTIRELGQTGQPEDMRILLSHRPDAALLLDRSQDVDLAVAGHTHGGQIVLPYFGPLITLTRVPRNVAAGGLHRLPSGQQIYVSRGVGMERHQAPPVRVLCPPEISLLELQ
jgi:predicted MPP superfamily phosphohydrolase